MPDTLRPVTGKLDFGHYLGELARSGYDGPLLIHGLDEHQVPDSVRFLRGHLESVRRC